LVAVTSVTVQTRAIRVAHLQGVLRTIKGIIGAKPDDCGRRVPFVRGARIKRRC